MYTSDVLKGKRILLPARYDFYDKGVRGAQWDAWVVNGTKAFSYQQVRFATGKPPAGCILFFVKTEEECIFSFGVKNSSFHPSLGPAETPSV